MSRLKFKTFHIVLSRRQRLLPAALIICALVLGYFCWYTDYKRKSIITVVELVDSSRPILSETPTTKPQKKVLLVSAFYPLAKSKHTDADYADWLRRFLGHISTDIYFFTTPEMEPLVRRARDALLSSNSDPSHPPQLIINTTFPSPFSIPPLLPHKHKYEQMHAWDREHDIHSPELYAIWNAKPWFLKEGLRSMRMRNFGDYDYAFWSDAGSFRHEHAYEAWPDGTRAEEIWEAGFKLQREQWRAWDAMRGDDVPSDIIRKEKERRADVTRKEDLVFFPVAELPGKEELGWREEQGPIDLDFSEGGFELSSVSSRANPISHRNFLRGFS
jgi:hypothetical protein